MSPKRADVELQIKNAFREFVVTGGFLGLRPGKVIADILWDKFCVSLIWRLDKLYGGKIKSNAGDISFIDARRFDRVRVEK